MKIEYRIMGIPSRANNIELLKKLLEIDDRKVFIDVDRHYNPMWTWKQTALLDKDSDTTHLCIVQDDAILPERFKDFCDRMVKKYSEEIILLINRTDMTKKLPYYVMCQPGYCTGGVAIIVPFKYVNDIIEEQEREYPGYLHDDNWIVYWAYNHGVKVIAPFPSVIDTLDGSSIGHNGRKAYGFCNNPMEHNWANATYKKYAKGHDFSKPASWDKDRDKNLV